MNTKIKQKITGKELMFKTFIENSRNSRGLKLVGECNHCGQCCNPVTSYSINSDNLTMDVVEKSNTPCTHLDLELNKCKNYKGRGILCSCFPYLPENLFPNCGFHFEQEERKDLKLSVVMIVKNESKCLDRCLTSVVGADEIIIADTGSTDNTIEIAKKYTNKIFYYKWNDNFAEARNYALSQASGNWILSIDADEWLFENGIERIRKAIKIADEHNQQTIGVIMEANISLEQFYFPRLFKRCKEVYWCGAIHNYLNVTSNNKSDIKITYSYSNAHDNDPDRALRILKQEVKNNPECIRETFYLAREYFCRKDWITAAFWYKDYLTRANWAPEWSEGYLMLARCYWNLDKADEAKDACLQAIKINADFAEAMEFMAELCGVKNRKKWLQYASLAESNDVLTLRAKKEKGSDYYNELFGDCSDMSRYYHLYNKIGQLVGDEKVLDIGCGVATLQNFIPNYSGFDFAEEAIKIANNKNVWVGDAYNKKNYVCDYDVYVSTETLEHLDDLKVIENIPQGKKVIFSVPSFEDASHLRIYSEQLIYKRWGEVIEIKEIIRFNWNEEWRLNSPETSNYILLIIGNKK